MANILYLVHRLPYPPNKGDKVRSYHLLKHLAARHRVFLATFVDDPHDMTYVDAVRGMCAGLHVSRLHPKLARLRSLRGLVDARPLTLAYYTDQPMREWVDQVCRQQRIDAIVAFSSAMGPYAERAAAAVDGPILVDLVDVDSAKWRQYASQHRWPLSWVYAREGARLLAYERHLARRARRAFLVTDNEVALFRQLAPDAGESVSVVGNGVDAQYFSPGGEHANPYRADEQAIVFTGAMDYWPNIDAATWFATEMLPALREWNKAVRLYVVGRSPAPAVLQLASDGVVVTGTVPDVRPFLQHAAVVVAPMRVARGVQNKILEAMAMGRPVVAAAECVEAIAATDGEEIVAAHAARDYVDALQALMQDPGRAKRIGAAGRACVVERFSWDAHLSQVDRYLPPSHAAA